MAALSPPQELHPRRSSSTVRRTPLHWETHGRTDAAPVNSTPALPESWLDPASWNSEQVIQRTSQLLGIGGFRALMIRAVAVARQEHEWLLDLRVDESGCLTGLESVLSTRSPAEREAACRAVRDEFRMLLDRFLGADFAERITGGAWPVEPCGSEGEPGRSERMRPRIELPRRDFPDRTLQLS